jgi:DNA-binding transcriptional ArsR family regulator
MEVSGQVGDALSGRMGAESSGGVYPATGTVEVLPYREISDVETLRVVADQTRLAILRTLMVGPVSAPPIMSAKELAAALHEPQTKLYRHLKQLEDAGLIQVAEVRLVSGIVEQRYRAGQVNLRMSPSMLTDPSTRTAATESLVAAINDFRDELAADISSERARLDGDTGVLFQAVTRIPAEKAAELRDRLNAVIRELSSSTTPDGVEAHAFIAWYETG